MKFSGKGAGGGGSKAVRKFSGNSSVFGETGFPKDGFPSGLLKISITSKVFLQEIQDCPLPEN